MHAEDLMTRYVHTCSETDTLVDAARSMWEYDIGWLPVLNAEGHVVAVVTDRDICMAGMFQGIALSQLRVATAMSRELVTCAPNDEIGEVEFSMRRHQLRRMPVVDSYGDLVGVVTLADLVRAVERGVHDGSTDAATTVDTLASITRSRHESPREADFHREFCHPNPGAYRRSDDDNDVWQYE
jgi:CBS domain-containing protein